MNLDNITKKPLCDVFGLIGGVAGGAIQALENQRTAEANNAAAAEREAAARSENYAYNEMAASNADKRQRAQFNDMYSYSAQVREMKKAGLSPSMTFGGGGGQSGASAPQGGGAAGVSPNVFGLPPVDFAQVTQALANANLANANAEKAEAEKDTIKGENARGIAEIQEILSKAGYNKAAESLAKANTAYQELKTFVGWQTADSEIQTAARAAQKLLHEADKAYEEATQAGLKTSFDKETYGKRVEQVGADLALTYAECALKNSQKQYTDEQKNALRQQVLQGWVEIGIKYKEMLIHGSSQRAAQRYLEDSIKAKNRELGIKETEMWLDFGIDCANSVIKLADLITDLIPQTAMTKGISNIFSKSENTNMNSSYSTVDTYSHNVK